MASVSTLKKIVEGSDSPSRRRPENVLLEVFCVDTSISMARSQSFPYIFGESKLSICRRIIYEGFSLPENSVLHTAVVTFDATHRLAVPFAEHTPEQVELFKAALTNVEHHKGSAIFSSYAFCEKMVSEYQHERGLQGCKVLIHLFTDGIDNGSLTEDVDKYQMAAVIADSQEGLRQSFLYSFDNNFEQSSTLAKSLQAHLVVIHESELNTALEDRDKWVLKFLAHKPKISKAHQGFSLAKGYTPDLASVYKVLQKAYRFFSSGKAATQEGLFRVNANVNESKRLASQLLVGNENLNDFEDSLLVAHALKTALGNSPPILPPVFQHTLIDVAQLKVGSAEALLAIAKTKVEELPHINKECFHILLFLLQIIAKESSVNKMTSANLASIFTYLLFPELLVPKPKLQDLVVLMIDNCQAIFPGQPKLKALMTTSLDMPDGVTIPRPASPTGAAMTLDSDREAKPVMIPLPGTAAMVASSSHSVPPAGASEVSAALVPASALVETVEEPAPRVKIEGGGRTLLTASEHEGLQKPEGGGGVGGGIQNPASPRGGADGSLFIASPSPAASLPSRPVPPVSSASATLERPLPPHLRKPSAEGPPTNATASGESSSQLLHASPPKVPPPSSEASSSSSTASLGGPSSSSAAASPSSPPPIRPTPGSFAAAAAAHAQSLPPPAQPPPSVPDQLARATSASSLNRPSMPPPATPSINGP